MTRAELKSWRDRLGVNTRAAARLLGLSVGGLRKQLGGERRVTARTRRGAENITLLLSARIWPSGWLPTRRKAAAVAARPRFYARFLANRPRWGRRAP
jgi:hypothetical protein